MWLSTVRQNCGLVDLDTSNSLGNKSHGSKGMALGIEPAVQDEGQLKYSLTSDQVLIDICFNYIWKEEEYLMKKCTWNEEIFSRFSYNKELSWAVWSLNIPSRAKKKLSCFILIMQFDAGTVPQTFGLGNLEITDGLLPFGFHLGSYKKAFWFSEFPKAKYLWFWSTIVVALGSVSSLTQWWTFIISVWING